MFRIWWRDDREYVILLSYRYEKAGIIPAFSYLFACHTIEVCSGAKRIKPACPSMPSLRAMCLLNFPIVIRRSISFPCPVKSKADIRRGGGKLFRKTCVVYLLASLTGSIAVTIFVALLPRIHWTGFEPHEFTMLILWISKAMQEMSRLIWISEKNPRNYGDFHTTA